MSHIYPFIINPSVFLVVFFCCSFNHNVVCPHLFPVSARNITKTNWSCTLAGVSGPLKSQEFFDPWVSEVSGPLMIKESLDPWGPTGFSGTLRSRRSLWTPAVLQEPLKPWVSGVSLPIRSKRSPWTPKVKRESLDPWGPAGNFWFLRLRNLRTAEVQEESLDPFGPAGVSWPLGFSRRLWTPEAEESWTPDDLTVFASFLLLSSLCCWFSASWSIMHECQ